MNLNEWKNGITEPAEMVEAQGSGRLAKELGDMLGEPLPCIVDGLQQILLCTSNPECLHRHLIESCTCQSSPGGCRRDKGLRCSQELPGQMSRAGQAGVGTCSPWLSRPAS